MENLGNGIVLFRDAFSVSDAIIQFLSSLRESDIQNNYIHEFNEDGSIKCLVNKSGHRFIPDDLSKTCIRMGDYYQQPNSKDAVDFFNYCDESVYRKLLEYIEIFPMLLPCIWWKTKGHPILYPKGSEQGLHCDNDINYKPGFEPRIQLGSRHVLAAMCYLNNDFTGGEIVFPYAGVVHAPKVGDILLFPANYICAHYVAQVADGERYAYLQYFGNGSSSPEYGVSVCDDLENIHSGQVWMNNLFIDYRKYIESKYGVNNRGDLLLPLQREFHSSELG